jgi:hypothetical protein
MDHQDSFPTSDELASASKPTPKTRPEPAAGAAEYSVEIANQGIDAGEVLKRISESVTMSLSISRQIERNVRLTHELARSEPAAERTGPRPVARGARQSEDLPA